MKQPLAVILTDTHKNKDNLNLVFNIFSQAIDLAKELGVKYVFHAGDFFTNRVGQNLGTLICMKNVLDLFRQNDIKLFAIAGNHDKTNQDSEESYLDIFSEHSSFELIRNHKEFMFKANGSRINVSFLPFFSSSYNERLEQLKDSLRPKYDKRILITHTGFNSVKNNDGSRVTDGTSPESVRIFDKVLVGHYHD